MDTQNACEQNSKYIIESIMRWLLFGIIFVVTPPLLYVAYRIIVGYEVDYIEYIPDILLVMLSVSCNLINTCVDSQKKVAYALRWILGIMYGAISFCCWGLFLLMRFLPSEELKTKGLIWNNAERLFYFSLIVIITCALIGSIIEWYTNKVVKNKNQ